MRRSAMTCLAVGFLATLAAAPARAQPDLGLDAPEYRWSGWRTYWENDTFVLGEGTDRHYTNGIRFTLTEHPDRTWAGASKIWEWCRVWICWAKAATDSTSVTGTWVFGQNMFTPGIITTFDPDPDDRPFAGFLYGGYQTSFGGTIVKGSGGAHLTIIPQNFVEISLGVLGPMSLAGGAQAGVHVLRESRIPKGWLGEIPTEPTAQLLYNFRIGFRGQLSNELWIPQLELTPHLTGALGTVQTFAEFGGTARFGWNLTGLAKDVISFTLVPPTALQNWEIAAVYTWARRRMFRNAFLDAGFMGDAPSVLREPWVTDRLVGAELRADPFTLSYRLIRRTQEMTALPGEDALPDHKYGSASLSYTLGTESTVGDGIAWVLEHMLIEAGFGSGATVMDGVGVRGRAAQVALGPVFGDFGASVVMGGVVREATVPGPGGAYTDLFFHALGLVGWWAPWDRVGFGRPLFRLGVGKAKHTRQMLDGGDHTEVVESGARPLVGLGYEIPLPISEQVALGLDATWSRVPLTAPDVGSDGAFLAVLVGIKWRPAFE